MKTHTSFGELAAWEAAKEATVSSMAAFNAGAPVVMSAPANTPVLDYLQTTQNVAFGYTEMCVVNDAPRIYDHLTDEAGTGRIERMPDDVIDSRLNELRRMWQRFGMTRQEMEAEYARLMPQVIRLTSEQDFRVQLNKYRDHLQKYQKDGIQGILFDDYKSDLFPFDPQVRYKVDMPPSPNEVRNGHPHIPVENAYDLPIEHNQ